MRSRLGQIGNGLAAILLLMALIGGGVYVFDWWSRGRNAARLEASAIRALPLGSSWRTTEAWFASHGVSSGGGSGPPRRTAALLPNDGVLTPEVLLIELEFAPDGTLQTLDIRRLNYDL